MARNGDVHFGSANDFYKPQAERHPAWMPVGASMTRQEFAEECDINLIMERYERTGEMPANMRNAEPVYIDCTQLPTDLRSYLDFMNSAQDAFMQLPAKVRKEFDNDPTAFVEFATQEDNLDQMKAWGLTKPEEVPPAPQKVEIVNPPSATPLPPAPELVPKK